MSKTYKDSREFRELVKTTTPAKTLIRAYRRKLREQQYRTDPAWKSGLEHRLGGKD